MNDADNWVLLAHIVRPQGRRGEVLADLHTDFPERFSDRTVLSLRLADGEPTAHTLESFWLPTGKSAGRIVFKFAGVDSISEAEALAGHDVVLPSSERVTLAGDEFYVSDLNGCIVSDGSADLGTVVDVHFPSNTDGKRLEDAAPILIVERSDGDELMIPLAKEFLKNADLGNKRLLMQLPKGLVDING